VAETAVQESVPSTKKPQGKRLAPEDWIRAAIEALLAEGTTGLRIASLARRLGVTPGSFYWHFRDRGQFRSRVLQYWREQMLLRAAAAAELAGSGADQLRALPEILMNRSLPKLDLAMRRWAVEDPVVSTALARADGLRFRVVLAMFLAAGFDEHRAKQRARLVGWAFRGSSGVDDQERLIALRELIEALLHDAG